MKTCHIVAAGDFCAAAFRPAPGDYIIAADAGYRYLQRLGVVPDMVIGDFDSLGAAPRHPNVRVCPVRKDDTDTLIAVRTALAEGMGRILIHGGVGGPRPDHTLANLQTLVYADLRGAEAYLMGDGFTLTALTAGELCFRGCTGGFSIFCHGDRAEGVTETGSKYTLDNACLTGDFPLGVSNAFAGEEETRVAVRRGTLVVWWQGAPGAPLPARTRF